MEHSGKAIPIPRLSATERIVATHWALLEQQMLVTLNQAAVEFVERYTRKDGTLIWRQDWPGMDGSDDPYEGFMNLALLYVLGGSDELYETSRRIWEAITWQWTEYGQIYREFDAYYDWMHHGEGSLYLYFLGLAGPATLKDKQRAMNFARMYMGEDAEADNYNRETGLFRSPLTGSRGPRYIVTAEDWSTHRGILDDYLAPFEDIPGVDFTSGKCPWSQDEVYSHILRLMNERMNRGDVPLNLNATTLITHAFLYQGDAKYQEWVVQYLEKWKEFTQQNGGITPDNVGSSGEIGEYMDGKWWGGYYGWRWPHGFLTIIEPMINACMNAVLLTGEMEQLSLARGQIDANWGLGKEVDGRWLVPNKHFDAGWHDYRNADPKYPVYLWTMSMADEDLKRVERIPRDHDWNEVIIPNVSGYDKQTGRATKHFIGNTLPWFQYITGRNPGYPEAILAANTELISRQLVKMHAPEGDPSLWTQNYNEGDYSSIHAWQEMCPLYFEGLVQLTLGGPMHISHGGLQHGSLRYWDAGKKRPGLPQGVSALVTNLTQASVALQLVNTDLIHHRELVVQAGTFGEHSFTKVDVMDAAGRILQSMELAGTWLEVAMPAGTGLILNFTLKRYVNKPSYGMPWPDEQRDEPLQGRRLTL